MCAVSVTSVLLILVALCGKKLDNPYFVLVIFLMLTTYSFVNTFITEDYDNITFLHSFP